MKETQNLEQHSSRALKITLADVVSSPFRDFTLNPLVEAKIAALIESISTTGFWKNIVVRQIKDGKFEIIAGHHRVEALRRSYKASDEFDFNVVKLADAEVLQKWSRDHDDAYNHDLCGVVELVKAVVTSLANGEIKPELMPVPKNTDPKLIRYAPSFVPDQTSTAGMEVHPYTILSVAKFLGYIKRMKDRTEPRDNVRAAVKYLEMVERKLFTEKEIKSFTRDDNSMVAKQVISVANSAEKKDEIRKQDMARLAAEARARNEATQKALIEKRQREQKAAELVREVEKKQRQGLAPKQEEKVKEQIKEAKQEVKNAGRQVARTKAAIAKRREIEAEQKRKDDEQRARRAEEDRVRWVNGVVTQGNKTFDRFCMVRNNFLGLSKAERKHSQITASDKKKLLASLEGICDRVRETIAALKDAPVIEPERSAR